MNRDSLGTKEEEHSGRERQKLERKAPGGLQTDEKEIEKKS